MRFVKIMFSASDWSGGGLPGGVVDGGGEAIGDVDAVFDEGGFVGTDQGEGLGSVHGPPAT